MTQIVTQSTAADIIVLLSSNNVAVTGLTFADVVVEYRKEGDPSFTAKVLTAPDFTEIGSGTYTVAFTAAELDTVGSFTVKTTGVSIDQSITIANVAAAGTVSTTITLDTCTITGHVFDLSGNPMAGASVEARVLGQPSIEQSSAAVTDDLVSAKTDANGEFFLSLVRLADVEVFIPRVNLRRRIVVPNQASANLFQIP